MNNQTIRELRAIAKERGLRGYSKLRRVELVFLLGAKDFDEAVRSAARRGHIEIVKLCKAWGAKDFDEAMWREALRGHIEIVKLCKAWGATNFDEAMQH